MGENFILITRPASDAEDFAKDVSAEGFKPLLEPMLGIYKLPFEMPDLSKIPALVFTSANAVRMFGCPAAHRDISIFAVGAHTADEARRQGFTKIFSAEGDGFDLAALIKKKLAGQDLHILHIRGEHTARPLDEMLEKDRIKMDTLVVYAAKTEDHFTSHCRLAIQNGDVQAVTFFSKRTAENFIRLIETEKLFDSLKGIKALCISGAVLECVRAAPWQEAYSAERPDRPSMLNLLRTVCVRTK